MRLLIAIFVITVIFIAVLWFIRLSIIPNENKSMISSGLLMNEDKHETALSDNVFTNSLRPNAKQVARLITGDNKSPIYMVNLLKFKKYANYPDKRVTTLSGQEAYSIYAEELEPYLKQVGGKIIFQGEVNNLLIGTIDELWDAVAVVYYPSKKALLKMINNTDYQKIEIHRQAGLEGQLNIETTSYPLQQTND
ncbi:DUF1330 domain-containing protein [Pseudomonadota bacterium]|nr:DUF1330 domain-containing protein [Pseudomonadota bacterium]